MTRQHACLLIVAALALCVIKPAWAQTAETPPSQSVQLQGGEIGQLALQAGGNIDASTLAGGCVGYVAATPDVTLDYVASAEPLTISAVSTADTTLIVRSPNGAYYCDDDGGDSGLNPRVIIAEPGSGQYEIWIGTYGGASLVPAELQFGEGPSAGFPPGPEPSEAQMPPFPRWPPPRASARTELPRDIFAGDANLGRVADRLTAALRAAGNARASFYSAPGGFILVARLERIRNDARPATGAARFVEPQPGQALKPDDPLGFVEALFFAPEGRYRQVMFVVTDQPVGESAWTLTSDAAGALLAEGSAGLAHPYRRSPFTPGHRVEALIYEFRKQGEGQAVVNVPGRWNASTHLTRSGVLANLRR